MSNPPPKDVALRGFLKTLFHLKKSAAESHLLLVKAYGEHAHPTHIVKSGHDDSKVAISTWKAKNGDHWEKLEDAELQKLLDEDDTQKTTRRRFKCDSFKQASSYVWKPWERFKTWENGCCTNWTRGSKTEPLVEFSSQGMKESGFFIKLWRGMKNGILNGKNHGSIQNH